MSEWSAWSRDAFVRLGPTWFRVSAVTAVEPGIPHADGTIPSVVWTGSHGTNVNMSASEVVKKLTEAVNERA